MQTLQHISTSLSNPLISKAFRYLSSNHSDIQTNKSLNIFLKAIQIGIKNEDILCATLLFNLNKHKELHFLFNSKIANTVHELDTLISDDALFNASFETKLIVALACLAEVEYQREELKYIETLLHLLQSDIKIAQDPIGSKIIQEIKFLFLDLKKEIV